MHKTLPYNVLIISFLPDDLETFRRLGHLAVDMATDYLSQIRQQPVFHQTRGFRALKLWMVLQSAGRQGLTQRIARHNALAQHLASLIDAAPDFERMAPVSLSIVCFRYIPSSLQKDEAAIEQLNRAIVPFVQSDGEAFITSTVLHGQFALRACTLHDATTEADIAALLAIVRRAGETLARKDKV